jgi:nucleotide-binding universal stress UspA family protein
MTGGRVVVGVSGSPSSLAALRRASEEAWRSGRPLVAVHTWEPPEGEIIYARTPSPELAALWERQARRRLADALAGVLGVELRTGGPCGPQLAASGLWVEPVVVRACAWYALPMLAAEPEDLLVLGGGGRRRFGLLRGPVRRRVLARAVCPVLTVGPPTASRAARRALRAVEPADFALR